jgi:hypothetical protein
MLALNSVRRLALELYAGPLGLLYAAGCAGLASVLIVFAFGRDQSAPRSMLPFLDRWHTTTMAFAAPLLARQIKTISILPGMPEPVAPQRLPEPTAALAHAVPIPPVSSPQNVQVDLPVVNRRELARGPARFAATKGPDICRGKGRIITKGGKSWRCRR